MDFAAFMACALNAGVRPNALWEITARNGGVVSLMPYFMPPGVPFGVRVAEAEIRSWQTSGLVEFKELDEISDIPFTWKCPLERATLMQVL